MADPTLIYKSIASARTKAKEPDETDARPIRNYMPMPFEGIVDLVRDDLGVEVDEDDLAEYVRNRNAGLWTEKLKNVTAEPVMRNKSFMHDSFQWECRRLAGFARQEKPQKQPRPIIGTLENIYSVVQELPPVIWEALTGSKENLSEKSASELKVISRESLQNSEWSFSEPEVSENRIVWEFTRGEAPKSNRRNLLTIVGKTKKGAVAKSATSIAISAGNLADRKFGAYLDHVLDIDADFREISTSKQLHFKKKLSLDIFDLDIISDDFLSIGNVEIEKGSLKYDGEVLKCMQLIFNEFRLKNLSLSDKLPEDFTGIEEAMRGKKIGGGYQNLLSRAAMSVFEGGSAAATLDDKDERRRVHGKQIWVLEDNTVRGLLWVKKYKKTRWAELFKREFNSNVDTSTLEDEFNLPTSTPPFSKKADVKSKIDELIDPANGLYIEVCHVENNSKLSLLLNLFATMLFGKDSLFVVSNIPPYLASADDTFNTDVWKSDRLGPRIVPDPQEVLDQESYLGFQKTFDLRMNIMKSDKAEDSVTLQEIYNVKSEFPESFLLPPVYWLMLKKENENYLDLCDIMWQDDFMFYNDTWHDTKLKPDESTLRGLFKLSGTELLYSEFKNDKVFNPGLGEYVFKLRGKHELQLIEAYEFANYDHERIDSAKAAGNVVDNNAKFRTSRFRNGTLSPRLIHYEMTRFLPNLNEIRTMCALLLSYKEKTFDLPVFKSAAKSGKTKSVKGGEDFSGGSVCSRASNLTDLIAKMQDELEVEGGLEPIVEMDIGVEVDAGLNI